MLPSQIYHIYSHANGNENIFRNEENYHFFLKKYANHVEQIADTFAYCLMPNHFHILVRIKSEEELTKVWTEKFDGSTKLFEGLKTLEKLVIQEFSNVLNGYTQALNKVFNRKGSLFMHPFKRKLIDNETYFTRVVYYIHSNPVHHGFVKNIEDWKHSSYHSLISNKETKLDRNEVLKWFFGKEEFVKYHNRSDRFNQHSVEDF
ncbi:MAG: hypothetical protein EAZ27_09770 [Cytophagales bacterium]|nr:MAG: hypothetical protein EAZ27_09770 [Cytophagales bacterium]